MSSHRVCTWVSTGRKHLVQDRIIGAVRQLCYNCESKNKNKSKTKQRCRGEHRALQFPKKQEGLKRHQDGPSGVTGHQSHPCSDRPELMLAQGTWPGSCLGRAGNPAVDPKPQEGLLIQASATPITSYASGLNPCLLYPFPLSQILRHRLPLPCKCLKGHSDEQPLFVKCALRDIRTCVCMNVCRLPQRSLLVPYWAHLNRSSSWTLVRTTGAGSRF